MTKHLNNFEFDIRKSEPGDIEALEVLYGEAFPDEDLFPLVRSLLGDEYRVLSMVAVHEGKLFGHVLFTQCYVQESGKEVYLLGPVAVIPRHQKKGIGSTLIKHGLRQIQSLGVDSVYVLGDPNYYGRFGFKMQNSVKPPYPIPNEWISGWQGICLGEAKELPSGVLKVPCPWRSESLWVP